MCLVVDLERTEACREQIRAEGGARTVYKFLRLRESDLELVSPVECGQEKPRCHVWKPGWQEATGTFPSELFEGMVA